jgi:esterase/lipase superfamily enzyme
MPQYWMINDRNKGGAGTEPNNDGLTYWTSDTTPLTDIANWNKQTPTAFQKLLIDAADQFPQLAHSDNEKQSHVTLLIHGYNVDFSSATSFYQHVCDSLFSGPDSLGICVLYDWPSFGSVLGYEPDRAHARKCAEDLTDILSNLFDWLLKKQKDAIKNPDNACKAKVSVIAHSMGNYVMQKALSAAWTRKNQPLLVSLVNQLIMVAADVDNDLFDAGSADYNDGNAMANLIYRITSFFSGRDAVLGASAGLKHFGTRRLGRSGLAHRPPLIDAAPQTDNVWDIDCSTFFPGSVEGMDIHGAYFHTDSTIALMRKVLQGIDRGVLDTTGETKGTVWP